MAPAMSPEWRKVNLICSLVGHGRVVLRRQPIPPIRPDLLALFDVAGLTKYMTGNELAGLPRAAEISLSGGDALTGYQAALRVCTARVRRPGGPASAAGFPAAGHREDCGRYRDRPGIACRPRPPLHIARFVNCIDNSSVRSLGRSWCSARPRADEAAMTVLAAGLVAGRYRRADR